LWTCPRCRNELGDYNGYCEYCFQSDKIKVYNPDKYYIREVCIHHICHAERSEAEMTPQEELFKELFTGAVKIVAGMDALTRRAYREEMQKIAYEARVHVAAVDKIDEDEKKEKRRTTGFERSLNTDQSTTDAINTIKERQKRLTKQEKIQAGLEEMFKKSGMAHNDAVREAQRLMGAGTILAVKNPEKAAIVETAVADLKTAEKKIDSNTSGKMFNPFAK
jgi:hypothetical protein